MLLLPTRFALQTWIYSLVIGTMILTLSLVQDFSSILFGMVLIVPAMILSAPFILLFDLVARLVLRKSATPIQFHSMFLVACIPLWLVMFLVTHNFWLVSAYVLASIGLQLYRVVQSIRRERIKVLW